MADNEIFAVFVEPGNPNTLDPVRCYAKDAQAILADDRDAVMIKFMRPKAGGGYFYDEYSGWRGYQISRFKGKGSKADGTIVTRAREKDGGTPAEARDVAYDDDQATGRQKVWPSGMENAAMGGQGRLAAYDYDASDYDDLLADAQALDPTNTGITLL